MVDASFTGEASPTAFWRGALMLGTQELDQKTGGYQGHSSLSNQPEPF